MRGVLLNLDDNLAPETPLTLAAFLLPAQHAPITGVDPETLARTAARTGARQY